jgi:hypothetical protein
MFMRSTKLSATTKLSAEHKTPPIANVLLAAGFLLSMKVYRLILVADFYPVNIASSNHISQISISDFGYSNSFATEFIH